VCSRCKQEKPHYEFFKTSICIECRTKRANALYRKTRDKIIDAMVPSASAAARRRARSYKSTTSMVAARRTCALVNTKTFYRYVVMHNFPSDYRLLCFNSIRGAPTKVASVRNWRLDGDVRCRECL
jgi:hypothetical protein